MQEESISPRNSFWCNMEKDRPKSTSLLSDGPQSGVDLQRDCFSIRVAAESRFVTAATEQTAPGWGLGFISGSATNLHVRLMAHWLFFLPLLKDIAIFDNNPLWNSVVSMEGKHCIQTIYVVFLILRKFKFMVTREKILNFQELPSSRDSHRNKHSFLLQPPY